MLRNRNGAITAARCYGDSIGPSCGFYHSRPIVRECDAKALTGKNLIRRVSAIQKDDARGAVVIDNHERRRMVG